MTASARSARLRILVQQVGAHAGLYRDQRHAVRDHVVQLPGDPQAFLDHRPLRRDLSPRLGGGQQVALVCASLPHGVADRAGRDADRRAGRDVDDAEVGNARALQGDERRDDQDEAGGGLATGAVLTCRPPPERSRST